MSKDFVNTLSGSHIKIPGNHSSSITKTIRRRRWERQWLGAGSGDRDQTALKHLSESNKLKKFFVIHFSSTQND